MLKPIGDLGRFSLSVYVWHLLLGGFIAHVFSRNNFGLLWVCFFILLCSRNMDTYSALSKEMEDGSFGDYNKKLS